MFGTPLNIMPTTFVPIFGNIFKSFIILLFVWRVNEDQDTSNYFSFEVWHPNKNNKHFGFVLILEYSLRFKKIDHSIILSSPSGKKAAILNYLQVMEKLGFFNYFDYSQTKFYVYWQSGIEHHGQKKHGHTSLTYAATVYLYSVAEWIITFRSTT